MSEAGPACPLWEAYPGALIEVSPAGLVVRSNGRPPGAAPAVGQPLAELLEPGSREKWERTCREPPPQPCALELVFLGAESYTLRTFVVIRPAGAESLWLVEQPEVLSQNDVYETISAINAELSVTQRELSRERVRLERALAKEAEARAAAEASRQRVALLEAVGETALEAADVDGLLRAVAGRLRLGLGADTVNVMLLDADGEQLRTRHSEGLPVGLVDVPVPLGAGVIGRVTANGETLAVEDLAGADLVRSSLPDVLSSLAAAPLTAGGRVLGLVEVGTFARRAFTPDDITLLQAVAQRLASALDRQRLLEAERAAHVTAQGALRQRDEVLAIVAHDLRNPLNRIHMGTTLLKGHLRDEGDQRLADMVLRATRGMDRLIQDLLDVGRLEAGGLALDRSPVPVDALLREVAEQFNPQAESAGVAFEVAGGESAGEVRADRARLLRVFANLLDNAMRVTPRGGRIRVTAAPDRDYVEFRVADTGPGIPADQLPHVFDRFWQGTRERRGSAGLGLAIVKGIVEAHGGRVFVESTPGSGTALRFWIPTA